MGGVLGEYTEVFLEESEDQIEELNNNLLLLEKDHTNPEIINDIFRAAHSLKSSAAFVGLYNLSDLAHKMENLLQKIRDGALEVNTNLVNLLFQCFDLIRYEIQEVAKGNKIDKPYTEMIQLLDEYENNPNTFSDSSSKKSSQSKPNNNNKNKDNNQKPIKKSNNPDALVIQNEELEQIYEAIETNPQLQPYKIRVILKKDTPMMGLRFTLILQNLKSKGIVFKTKPSEEELESGKCNNILYIFYLSTKGEAEIIEYANIDMVETLNVSRVNLPEKSEKLKLKNQDSSSKISKEETLSKQPKVNSKQQNDQKSTKKESTNGNTIFEKTMAESKVAMKSIKVSSDKLDQLMNNVGELVITNSGFQKIYDDLIQTFGEDILFNELKLKIDQINRISKDLQSGIMNIRMVPIGTVFGRFSRLVRDLSLETGKEIKLVLKGESTELDKKVIDALGEPLIHLIRNSVDHGIEPVEERRKKGKPEVGTIELNAYQGGSNIMVEIRDDGRGLNRKKILEKAIEKGLVTPEDASSLSDNDIYQFIFAPGFSTAEKITDISGRGVGMNVVNKLIQEFKGKIIINSQEGVGTSFTLSFPQALAIIPSILVIMEEEVYAFPLSEVSETIKVSQEQITTLEGHEIINLRGEVLPIYRLNRIIGLADKNDREELPVIIVNYKNRKLGFVVDDLVGKHETVIKSLAKNFRHVPGLTGATIMGDGTIILVLDIPGLVELAGSEDITDYRTLQGEMMKRISSIHSLESTDSNYIFKTKHATNLFNARLYEMNSKEKLKKNNKSTKRGRKEEPEKIIVSSEELIREESSTSGDSITNSVEPIESSPQLPSPEAPISNNELVEAEAKEKKISESVVLWEKEEPKKDLYEHLEEKIEDLDEEHKKKAAEIIRGFIEQKNERLQKIQPHIDHNIEDLLTKDQLRKLESVMNTGMMNAAVVLSQLVGKEVELFVPEINLTNKEGLAKEISYPEENFFGMKVRMNGDLNGNLLMMFSEENGKEIAENLLGKKPTDSGKGLSEDSISVLAEISNIVCSGVINSLSNKTKTEILPSVPEFITGKFLEVLDIVKPERTKFLSMHTEFNHGGNNLIGILLFLPDFDELVQLISKI